MSVTRLLCCVSGLFICCAVLNVGVVGVVILVQLVFLKPCTKVVLSFFNYIGGFTFFIMLLNV